MLALEKRFSVWVDLGLLVALMAFSYFRPLPFPWKVPAIALIILVYVYWQFHDFRPVGLGRLNWSNTFLWGGLIAFTVVEGISNIFNPIMELILDQEVDVSAYGSLEGNIDFVKSYWWKAMISAAIAEEIFYRGFAFYVLEDL